MSLLRHGGRVVALVIDGKDTGSFASALSEIRSRLGHIGAWIALDGAEQRRPLEVPVDQGITTRATLTEPFAWGLPEAAAEMLNDDNGTLVVVESCLAFIANARRRGDCAAAFARRGYVEALRRETCTPGGSMKVSSVYTSVAAPDSPDVGASSRQIRLTAPRSRHRRATGSANALLDIGCGCRSRLRGCFQGRSAIRPSGLSPVRLN